MRVPGDYRDHPVDYPIHPGPFPGRQSPLLRLSTDLDYSGVTTSRLGASLHYMEGLSRDPASTREACPTKTAWTKTLMMNRVASGKRERNRSEGASGRCVGDRGECVWSGVRCSLRI